MSSTTWIKPNGTRITIVDAPSTTKLARELGWKKETSTVSKPKRKRKVVKDGDSG